MGFFDGRYASVDVVDLCPIRFATRSKTAFGDPAFLSLLAISLSPRLYPITVAANKSLVYGPDLRHYLMTKAAVEAVDRVYRELTQIFSGRWIGATPPLPFDYKVSTVRSREIPKSPWGLITPSTDQLCQKRGRNLLAMLW